LQDVQVWHEGIFGGLLLWIILALFKFASQGGRRI
jgi:hypothetical protein